MKGVCLSGPFSILEHRGDLSRLSAIIATPRQSEPAPSIDLPAAQLQDIVVEGRRLEEAARAFTEAVGEPPRGTRLARWNAPVCISVTNMRAEYGQFLIDRIAANALDAGVDVQGPGASPM